MYAPEPEEFIDDLLNRKKWEIQLSYAVVSFPKGQVFNLAEVS